MSIPEFIDLCSDEETEVTDVKPTFLSSISQEKTSNRFANDQPNSGEYFIKRELEETRHPTLLNGVPNDSHITDQACLYANGSHPAFGSPGSSVTPCRQFWKSGDYELGRTLGPVSRNGQNRLRIHPKFLHSNATSHKWAFGAIAELLDNAIDEVQNGATFVILDKFTNPQNGDPTLVIQDDGGGMDPESLRRCMSFGFSDKQSNSSIGQYGNGFKTSTMRLGADVIVFSRCMSKRVLTQSIGILSYTFLRQTGADDVVVPMVDYEFDPLTGAFGRLIRHDKKHFASNLSTILKWSPFSTEAELLEQFNDIGHHGTKVVVYNLWFNDDGDMELDFKSDRKDIVINGARKIVQKNSIGHILTQKNIANRLHYSLRAYSSVLYLRIPENFKIILRGEVVEPHHIVKDLTFRECISYKPQVGGIPEAEVLTTIGFVEGAPQVNVHGFNVYHRNRLILPFWRVAHNSYGKGRGVVGVLEANFIKPTHDKQDFEKSAIYQKLETRLKEMTYEYWDFHCHLIGYTTSKHPSVLNPAAARTNQMPQLRTCNGKGQMKMSNGAASITGDSQAPRGMPSCLSADSRLVTTLNAPTYSSPGQSNYDANSKTGLPHRRKHERHHTAEIKPLKKQSVAVGNADGLQSKHKALVECDVGHKRTQEVMTMMQQNKNLRKQCVEYEETVEKLLLKAEEVRRELREAQQVYKNLLEKHRSLDEVKAEKL